MDNKIDVIFKLQEQLDECKVEKYALEWKLQQTLDLLEKYSLTLMEYGIAILHE